MIKVIMHLVGFLLIWIACGINRKEQIKIWSKDWFIQFILIAIAGSLFIKW